MKQEYCSSICLLNVDYASQIICIYAQPDWHAQALISKYVNKNWKNICLIEKEVFLDQKYVFFLCINFIYLGTNLVIESILSV